MKNKLSKLSGNAKISAAVLFLACFSFLLYANSLDNSFMWDDREIILRDRYIRDLKFVPYLFTPEYNKKPYIMGANEYRPVTKTSFALDHSIWKADPFGFHLSNVILHVLNSILFFFLVTRLLRAGPGLREKNRDITLLTALAAALLYASHPVCAETVNWVKNRAGLLSVCFFFLSFLSLIISSDTSKRKNKISLYILSVFLFVLSLLSKETGISLPAAAFILFVFFDHFRNMKDRLLRVTPHLAAAVIFMAGKYTLFSDIPPRGHPDLISPGAIQRVLIFFKSLGQYIEILLIPFGLNAERPFDIPASIFDPYAVVGLFAFIILFSSAVFFFKRKRMTGFISAWLLLTVSSVSNIVFVQTRPIAEQRLYLAAAVFSLFIGYLFLETARYAAKTSGKTTAKIVVFPSAVLIFLFSARTLNRNNDWQDPYTFWSVTAEVSPYSSRASNNLGNVYYSRGDYTTAMKKHKKALRLDPFNANAYTNFGTTLATLGKYEEALRALHKAEELYSGSPDIYNNLAITYDRMGQTDEAVAWAKKAIKANPGLAFSHHNLGVIYARSKMHQKAIAAFEKAIELNPFDAGTFNNLGNVHYLRGNLRKAFKFYIKALDRNHSYANAIFNLSRLFAEEGLLDAAAFSMSKARRISSSKGTADETAGMDRFNYSDPFGVPASSPAPDSDIYIIMADAYSAAGDPEQAEKYYLKALRKTPGKSEVYDRLARFYISQEKGEVALTYLFKAIQLHPSNHSLYNNAGILLYKGGQEKAAAEMFKKALIIEPGNTTAVINLFRLLLSQGRENEAERILYRSLKRDPGSPGLYSALIPLLGERTRYKDIISIYEQKPEDTRLSAEAYNNAGIAYGNKGRTDKALELFMLAHEADPRNKEALYNLALTFQDLGRYEKALEHYEKVMELDPGNKMTSKSMADLLYRTGDLAGAAALYERYLALDPRDTTVLNNLGIIYARQDRPEKALAMFAKVLELDPGNAGAYFNMGNVRLNAGDLEAAAVFYKQAVDVDPSYAGAYLKLSGIYLEKGDREKALDYYNKARELGASRPSLEKKLYGDKGDTE
jgi:tetratricopeptide (TPR) repeat protein